MTNTLTANVPATLQQIAELTAAGCDIVRVAVPSQDDADALPEICRKSPIPVIADIHFQSKYVFQAIDAGCAAVRVNPGNIRKFDEVGPDICKAATDAGISLRIGVNAGSLDKELYAKYGGPTPEALVASALKEAHMFEGTFGFHDFKISRQTPLQRHHHGRNVPTARFQGRLAAAPRRHRGRPRLARHHQVLPGVRCALGRGHWRHDSRVSLRAAGRRGQGGLQTLGIHGIAPPQVRHHLLPELRPRPSGCDPARLRRHRRPEGRDRTHRSEWAVMGCIVNGPGEAREADLGAASGNGKGQIFIKGKVIKTVPEDQIVDTLLTIANDIAAQMEADGQVPVNSTGPVVVPIQHPGH